VTIATDHSAPVLQFSGIYKSFAGHAVLRGVDLQVAPGSIHFILGRSGAGKSILIKQVVGLVQCDAGSLELFGQNIVGLSDSAWRPVRATCQLIFQNSTLFDQLDVLHNVCMPLMHRWNLNFSQAREAALAALEQVQAVHLAHRAVAQLGAGLQKRVAMARALALQPRVLLYDEPTTSLDPVAARRTDRLMRALQRNAELTQVVVSHDLESTAQVASVVSFLHAGKIYYHGAPQAFLQATQDPVIGPFLQRRPQ
jgi:phospholipid/cholesterol/gamma-HCH transport system ATP-binding protein